MDSAVKAPADGRTANARLFAAGTGVTAALIAAAVVAFIAVAAFVGFDGMPFGSTDTPESTVVISGAANAAARTTGPASGDVADNPARPSAAAAAEMLAALAPGARNSSSPGGSSEPAAVNDPGSRGAVGGDTFGTPVPGDPDGPIVDGVDDTTGGLGLDLPLGEPTDDITKPVDDAVGGVLDGVGAGGVGDTVDDAAGSIVGGN